VTPPCYLLLCCLMQDRQEYENQDNPTARAAGAAAAPDVAAMLLLLKAPRAHLLTPPALTAAEDKPGVTVAPCYEMTATAAAAAAAAADKRTHSSTPPAAAEPSVPHSYPCHTLDSDFATTTSSTNSRSSTNSTHSTTRAMHGPSMSIMQDGQFGCCSAGLHGSNGSSGGRASSGLYRGPGGGMQPLLGLMLPGRRGSFSCSRGQQGHQLLADIESLKGSEGTESPTASSDSGSEGVHGESWRAISS